MSVEGIFRKNGNIRRLNDLKDAIDRDPSSVDLSQDNPVQLAALLKKFLRELPDPLMTYKLHRLFVASQCQFYSSTRYVGIVIPAHSFFYCSASVGRGEDALPALGCLDAAQEPSRYYGDTFCILEVGRLVRTHGRRNWKQDGPRKSCNSDIP